MKKFSLKSLLALVICVSIVVGCGDDNEVALNKCFLASVTSDSNTSTLTYNSDNKLTGASSTYEDNGIKVTETSTISYDTKGNVTKIQTSDSYSTYTYNDNNQVIRESYYEGDGLDDQTDYEYNSSGQLVKEQDYSISSSGVATKGSYTTYTYSSTTTKNPATEQEYSSGGTLYSTTEYTFDDKKTIYGGFSEGDVIFSDIAAAANNVTKQVYKSPSGTIQYTTTYTYEYNDKGYPTKATTTETYSGGTDTYVETYSYNCK